MPATLADITVWRGDSAPSVVWRKAALSSSITKPIA